MTATLNGTNGLIQAYDYQVLTTGFSYTFAAGTQVLVINPAGTLATGTIWTPTSPSDGMTITVVSTQQVTALSAVISGGSMVGAAAQLLPNQPLSWVWRSANTTWYPFSGGAGRASSLVNGTSQASTSGTSINFVGTPPWVKRVTVMFSAVSTNSTGTFQIQLGSTSGTETTGYTGATGVMVNAAVSSVTNPSTGFGIYNGGAAYNIYGNAIITLLDSTTNLWCYSFSGANGNTGNVLTSGGTKALPSILTSIKIIASATGSASDTFDGGSINILYE